MAEEAEEGVAKAPTLGHQIEAMDVADYYGDAAAHVALRAEEAESKAQPATEPGSAGPAGRHDSH
jgi:hypothetical protein